MSEPGIFDVEGFHAALDAERAARNLNWREVADLANVSQSTLSRLKTGTRPDIESFARLCRWAGVDANRFVQPPSAEEAPSKIASLLRADPNLDTTSAAAIEAILNAAYEKLRLQR